MNRAWTNIALMAAVTWLLIGAALVPAFAQQPPRLEIERHPESGGLHLSWPLDAAGFQLETTDDLSTGGSWLPWPDQPQPIGNILSLVIQYGEASAYYRLRDRSGAELPPDPATVAPALDPVAVSDLGSSTRFLYAGAQPIQTGVSNETIVARQAAVIRGKVSQGDGTALPGVAVCVLGHPEIGQTFSREDGAYDLAVNGGEHLTLCFSKTGFLAAQRAVAVPWQQYAFAPAVALVPLDPNVTPVVLGAEAPAQVARGSVQTDQDGPRQATVLLPSALDAWLRLADGSTQSVTTLAIRATEYTVGPNGPLKMPAELPPTVAYTYCVELSADEALAANAATLQFSKPVAFHVDNFLGFPVGTVVPVGWYDAGQGRWVAMENGRVIGMLGIDDGRAVLDVTGTGQAATASELEALGITDEERGQLASLYAPGASLSRSRLGHFSTIDLNYPIITGGVGATTPSMVPPDPSSIPIDFMEDRYATGYGRIAMHAQTVRESIPIRGTPLTLNYAGDRMPGRQETFGFTVTLTDQNPPPLLKRVALEIRVAGQLWTESFPPQPNLRHSFAWNGKDAYGRVVRGEQVADVRIGYVYDGYYARAAQAPASFGLPSGRLIEPLIPARQEVTAWQAHTVAIPRWNPFGIGLGGWTLSAHHFYDSLGRTLYLGTGDRLASQNILQPVITTVAGRGDRYPPQGYPATEASLSEPSAVAVAPDGTLYIGGRFALYKVGADGIIHLVAGGADGAVEVDGVPAVGTWVWPEHIALGPDGSFYTTASAWHTVRVIRPDGIIRRFAGVGISIPYGGENIPAVEASLSEVWALCAAPDGSVFIGVDGGDYPFEDWRLRRVGVDGLIYTYAGFGGRGLRNDGKPATEAFFASVRGIALAPDGSLYFGDSWKEIEGGRVRKITPDGIISTIAGSGSPSYTGDGGPAIAAGLSDVYGIALGPDGSLYLSTPRHHVIRKIDSRGIISTIAGGGAQFTKDALPATQTFLGEPRGIAVAPDGSIYFADRSARRVCRISYSLPGFDGSQIAVASRDGQRLFLFDSTGRHLSTLHAVTGAVLDQFAYDAAGRLAGVTDAHGNLTRIVRDPAGRPTAIVAPFGARTELELNEAGELARLVDPTGHALDLTYENGSLLAQIAASNGETYTFAYDSEGRVEQATAPEGGRVELDRTQVGQGQEIAQRDGDGLLIRSQLLSSTVSGRVGTDHLPDGTVLNRQTGTDGRAQHQMPDGSTIAMLCGADPRWGMQAPVLSQQIIKTPHGLSLTNASTRTIILANAQNPLSLIRAEQRTAWNGRTFTETYTAASRILIQRTPAGRVTTNRFDATGRVIERSVPGQQPQRLEYGPEGRLNRAVAGQGEAARTVTFHYGSQGYLSATVDALNRTNRFVRDAAGRLLEQEFPDGRVARFTPGAGDGLRTVAPPGKGLHQLLASAGGRACVYTPPAIGDAADPVRLFFNPSGHATGLVQPNGDAVTNTYDAAGRLAAVTLPQGQFLYAYATNGMLASAANPDGATVFYDTDGPLVTGMRWEGLITGSVERVFQSDLRLAALRVNGTNAVDYRYDADGFVTNAGSLVIERHPTNALLSRTVLGVVNDAFVWNGFGEVERYAVTNQDAPMLQIEYGRDALGRLSEVRETSGPSTTALAFAYDMAGRLIQVTHNGANQSRYEYDSNGNRLTEIRVEGGVEIATRFTYDGRDRIVSGTRTTDGGSAVSLEFSHDPQGNLVQQVVGPQTTRYVYDALNNLRRAELPDGRVIEYVLDGRHRAVGKKVDGLLRQGMLYGSFMHPVAELDAAGKVRSVFVYGHRATVPDALIRDGTAYRIVSDHRGSPRAVVNTQTGEVAQELQYDSFGRVVVDTNPGFQPFGFSGGLYDPDTRLVRFGARFYDADLGRWTQRDPMLFTSTSLNLYAYVSNDPLNRVDRLGLGPSAGPNWDKFFTGLGQFGGGLLAGSVLLCVEGASMGAATPAVIAGGTYAGWSIGSGIGNMYNAFANPDAPVAAGGPLESVGQATGNSTCQQIGAAADLLPAIVFTGGAEPTKGGQLVAKMIDEGNTVFSVGGTIVNNVQTVNDSLGLDATSTGTSKPYMPPWTPQVVNPTSGTVYE